MNNIEKYSNKLLTSAQEHLKNILDDGNEKEVHALRITIKKIYALLALLNYCNEVIYDKNKKLEKLYSRAGDIRELQLMIHELKKQIKLKDKNKNVLIENINKRIEKRIEKFRHHYQKQGKRVLNRTHSLINKSLQLKQKKETALYFSMMKEKINADGKQLKGNKKQIHLLRKEIKELNYNVRFLLNRKVITLLYEKKLNKWGQILGEWHNSIWVGAKLKKIISEAKPKTKLRTELLHLQSFHIKKSHSLLKKFKKDFITNET